MVEKKTYYLPTKVVYGRGVASEITSLLPVQKNQQVFLVVGDHFKKTKNFLSLKKSLGKKSFIYQTSIRQSDFRSINQLTSCCRLKRPNLIIAIGGGTIIDTAKAAAALAVNGGKVEDYLVSKRKSLTKPGIPVVAVPTTAGTGSEVTPFVVVWDTKNKKKFSLTSDFLYPKWAIVDPELAFSAPRAVAASSGIDALSQAIEAFWSKNHNPISDALALRAIELLVKNLEKAIKKLDQESKEAVSLGSLLAGMAFSNTKTTICHSVSYPLTAHWGIAHGQAVAITLPAFIRCSFPCLKEREGQLLKALGVKRATQAVKLVETLMTKIGLPVRLSELGIGQNDLDLIVKEGFDPDRATHAPWIPSPVQLKGILRGIL